MPLQEMEVLFIKNRIAERCRQSSYLDMWRTILAGFGYVWRVKKPAAGHIYLLLTSTSTSFLFLLPQRQYNLCHILRIQRKFQNQALTCDPMRHR